MVSGENVAREHLLSTLSALDSSSLVVAGSKGKLRVHIHSNKPAEVFLACEEFGQVSRQKADDIHRQQHLSMAARKVAIVTDSGADIPEADIDRHNIYMVPVRLNFGDQDYLDKVSITPQEFYLKLEKIVEWPQTSQPPPGDFIRQYDLLVSHGLTVVAPSLSAKLSGTLQAAEHAASRFEPGKVRVVNTQNATAGQGLITIYAAEAAEEGMDADQVVKLIEVISERTQTYALIQDLGWGVRGGRIPAFLKVLAEKLFLNPVLAATDSGQLSVRGVVLGRKNLHLKFARAVVRKLKKDKLYRFIICHCQALDAAKEVQHVLFERHPQVHSCQITDAGPAVGVHLGPGGVIVGVQEYLPPIELWYEMKES
jgi:DegV family protein with EDD domain